MLFHASLELGLSNEHLNFQPSARESGFVAGSEFCSPIYTPSQSSPWKWICTQLTHRPEETPKNSVHRCRTWGAPEPARLGRSRVDATAGFPEVQRWCKALTATACGPHRLISSRRQTPVNKSDADLLNGALATPARPRPVVRAGRAAGLFHAAWATGGKWPCSRLQGGDWLGRAPRGGLSSTAWSVAVTPVYAFVNVHHLYSGQIESNDGGLGNYYSRDRNYAFSSLLS